MHAPVVLWLLACGQPEPVAAPEVVVQEPPNVILYVIDGGGADLMSAWGYERQTTPFLAELAREGVRFEETRTTSAWTKPSTASFMTSLHHSVLGGFTTNEDRIPRKARTMAEHFDEAGYRTGVFTSNPFAGSMSGLDRGVDHFRDKGAASVSTSSVELHAEFLEWQAEVPGEPFWAHIQSTDVHEPHAPVEPHAGTWASDERRARFEGWLKELNGLNIERDTVLEKYRARLKEMDVDQRDFFRTQWDLYDETMAHNDAQLRLLVRALRERGEWENTVFVVTADHGHPAGSFSRFGRGMLDPQPADWEGALADSYRTHVPLLVVWPEQLDGGRVIEEPVSLIDLLPTLLDLARLPSSDIAQGRSLAPMLRGQTHAPEPLFIEQVQAYAPTGQMVGHIEVIDGRWAASLEVMPDELRPVMATMDHLPTAGGWRAARPHRATTPRMLLYDLEQDPLCTRSVHEDHPEEVAYYTELLEARWASHLALAATMDPAGTVEAGEEQLEALRTLGYLE